MGIVKTTAVIVRQTEPAPGIFDMRLRVPAVAEEAVPGQFVNLFLNDSARILPRPISICGVDPEQGELRLVYRVTGEKTGTAALSAYTPGTEIEVLGPLGNGFPLVSAETETGKTAVTAVIGGGIGIPPLLYLAEKLSGKTAAVLGYRDSHLFLKEEFEKAADRVILATEDGSAGTRGNVLDAMQAENFVPDRIMACGPLPMLRALKAYAAAHGIPCWVSMEERMACGVGACLGCVVKTPDTDPHSNVKNKRVCKDGPVFRAEEVEL